VVCWGASCGVWFGGGQKVEKRVFMPL